ncbi:Gamma-glutamyl cyclotransferase, AIG2-like [Halobiforma haloterrestris]|uniref:Gamma-glutamyl cyclotransferase, AIG2-like n=1 Tax=Natronobacterium haloterrestre TaxID=148448 RepID=A0A1I1E6U9_NATHA|nr:gamma-glutamylcyclotransferase family protein [Halobiforma haloterrestris]SFB82925.1 Gamma-glutamyl cyclotransferase, AIG2-like [Halobiforma haloterrestris]
MYVFVYGTLTDPDRVEAVLEGEPPARYELQGRATLEGLHRVDGRYPTLAPGGRVDGRLLAVDDVGLERLDRYEGVEDGLYVRVSVPWKTDAASAVDGSQEDDATLAVYVGDPARLGVADRVDWPGDGPFTARVRRYLERTNVVLHSDE